MRARILTLAAAVITMADGAQSQITQDALTAKPQAIVDLRTTAGANLVRGQWRYSDAKVVEVDHRSVGPDLRPSGPPNRALDIFPKAGAEEFDDAGWEAIPAEGLEQRRTNGRLSFNWYRAKVTLPDQVGGFSVRGSTVVFEVVVDDYAEVWVDGKLPLILGQAGAHLIKGFNAPNRVVLTRDAMPGQTFQLAVFGMNGPVSSPPVNYIWVRSATLDLYRAGDLDRRQSKLADIERKDADIDRLVPPDATLEKLAGGFEFLEGPVWVREGYLLFSDPNTNVIYRYTPDGQVSVFRTKSGYTGVDIGRYHQPGSNGLALDREGRLVINEHGNRRVTRLEKTGAITVLADRVDGMRLNSPNDLVFKSDGALYVTDPPFGLPGVFDDPAKETPWSGVYRVGTDGSVRLVTKSLSGPNGLAFSPDERYFYVDNWDPQRKVVLRYEVEPDGSLSHETVFFDMTPLTRGDDALDGMKVDRLGNLYVAGPGGIWVLSPEGKHLGTIHPPEHVANMAWGDADGRGLYITASTGLYRIRLNVAGTGAFSSEEWARR